MQLYAPAASFEPFFAPLNRPMIQNALALQEEAYETSPMAALDLHSSVQKGTKRYTVLRNRLTTPRKEVFQQIHQAIQNDEFTSEWLLKTLARYTPKRDPLDTRPISAEALSRWRESGLVHFQRKNVPDYDNGAAMIMLRRLVLHRERGWLPQPPRESERANYFAQEPLWWAWRQDSPTSAVVPCPVPLPQDIPPSALLWTTWLGAGWRPEWLRIGELGCCRWGATTVVNQTLLWNVTEEALEMWGVSVNEVYRHALKNDTPLTRHILASSALLQLATARLEEAQTAPLLSFAG